MRIGGRGFGCCLHGWWRGGIDRVSGDGRGVMLRDKRGYCYGGWVCTRGYRTGGMLVD